MAHELLRTTKDGGGETFSAAEAEAWLRRLGKALLAAQTTGKARQAFDAAIEEASQRPYGFHGRAVDLFEKRLRALAEAADRGRAP